MRSDAWSRDVTRGVTEGFRFPLLQGSLLLYSFIFYSFIPGASTVRDLWLCLAYACNPLNLLSMDWTLKPRAPAWLSSPGMHFLPQERAHQLRQLCLKAGLCYMRGHFLFPLYASQSMAPFTQQSHAAAHGPADQMILTWGWAARDAGGEGETWKLGSWEGSQVECMRWTSLAVGCLAVGYLARKAAILMTFHYWSEEAVPPFWWYSGFNNGFVSLKSPWILLLFCF